MASVEEAELCLGLGRCAADRETVLTIGVYDYAWFNAMYSNGASLFSEDGQSCYLADESIQEAVQFAKKLSDLNGGYTVTARDFDAGRAAFRPFLYSEYRAYQPYPWRVKKYSGFEWDCVSMPAGPSGGNVSELHTMLLGVSARTAHEELAWELCKLLSMDESVQMAADAAHKAGIWIGICGELAGDISLLPTFLAIGIDELSVSPSMVLPLRAEIRQSIAKTCTLEKLED